jgi:hypothetical protein
MLELITSKNPPKILDFESEPYKAPELSIEDKLFEVFELLNDEKQLQELSARNSNIS